MLGDKGLDTGLVAAVATNIGWAVLRAGSRQPPQPSSISIGTLHAWSGVQCPVTGSGRG